MTESHRLGEGVSEGVARLIIIGLLLLLFMCVRVRVSCSPRKNHHHHPHHSFVQPRRCMTRMQEVIG